MGYDIELAGLCPLSLSVDALAAMLNFELADHDVYDGVELQWFDDEVHGTGMLAFLSRRGDRRVDYYVQRGLELDRAGYQIGGGTGSWTEVDFDVARLEPSDDGVDAEARFTDVDGRLIEIRVDDRDGRPRRRAGLLAPVSAGIDRPNSLLLVWLPRFDLVRVAGTPPVIRIDGRNVATGRLPGARLHRRHLIKYAAPVVTVELNRAHDGPLAAMPADGRAVVIEEADSSAARLGTGYGVVLGADRLGCRAELSPRNGLMMRLAAALRRSGSTGPKDQPRPQNASRPPRVAWQESAGRAPGWRRIQDYAGSIDGDT